MDVTTIAGVIAAVIGLGIVVFDPLKVWRRRPRAFLFPAWLNGPWSPLDTVGDYELVMDSITAEVSSETERSFLVVRFYVLDGKPLSENYEVPTRGAFQHVINLSTSFAAASVLNLMLALNPNADARHVSPDVVAHLVEHPELVKGLRVRAHVRRLTTRTGRSFTKTTYHALSAEAVDPVQSPAVCDNTGKGGE